MSTHEERVARRAARRAKILAFLQRVKDFILGIEHKIQDALPHILDAGLKFMEGFKKVIDSGVVDAITAWIPGTSDDAFVAKVRSVSDKIIGGIIEGKHCMELPTREERWLCFINYFKGLSKTEQSGLYQQIHAQFLSEIGDPSQPLTFWSIKADESHLGTKIPNA